MIDINTKYRTRDGREVRIYATDGGDDFPVHGAIKDRDKAVWRNYSWHSNGFGVYSDLNLIEVRPRHKQTVWVNVYNEGGPTAHKLKEQADCYSCRIACIKVELDFEEGEGL